MVYVIGIAPEIASEDTLKGPEYFGQYGDLTKVVVNTNNVYNANRGGPSYSAYLTYSHPRESAIAILVRIILFMRFIVRRLIYVARENAQSIIWNIQILLVLYEWTEMHK